MPFIESVEKIAQAPIGNLGDPKYPFLQGLENKDLPTPHASWVWRARAGVTQGPRVFNSISLATFTYHNAEKKDALYQKITAKAVSSRTRGVGAYTSRYCTEGYLAGTANSLGFRIIAVHECIRAMRADLLYNFQPDKEAEFSDYFRDVVENFIRDNTSLYPSQQPKLAVALDEKWDRQSPLTFYQTMREITGSRSRAIGTWMPYEVEAMEKRYQARLKSGSPLSSLDEKVAKLKTFQGIMDFAQEATHNTGIPVDYKVIRTHRNALLYGQPKIAA